MTYYNDEPINLQDSAFPYLADLTQNERENLLVEALARLDKYASAINIISYQGDKASQHIAKCALDNNEKLVLGY